MMLDWAPLLPRWGGFARFPSAGVPVRGAHGERGRACQDLKVTYQDLNEIATKLKTGQGEVETKLGEPKSAVDALVGAGSTGSASGAFQTSYTEFNTGATKTIAGLEGLSTFLKKAAVREDRCGSSARPSRADDGAGRPVGIGRPGC